jgi:hypothetical protein
MKKEVLNFVDFFKTEVSENYESHDYLEDNESHQEDDVYLQDDLLNSERQLELTSERLNYLMNEFDLTNDEIESVIEMSSKKSDFYQLYRDINENFVCDIFIEGAKVEDSKVRLVLESKDWNLIFNGYIEGGKCHIPIKKLDILNEELTGEIKLEVIAEGNVFVPWSDKFIVKSTKRVSTLNESIKKNIDVKVGKIR